MSTNSNIPTQPKFIHAGNVLINVSRLIAMRFRPQGDQNSTEDHYLAVFDTGQVVVLKPEEGQLVIGKIAITSEA